MNNSVQDAAHDDHNDRQVAAAPETVNHAATDAATPARTGVVRPRASRRTATTLLLMIVALVAAWSVGSGTAAAEPPTAPTPPPAVGQCNNGNNIGGEAVKCDVQVVNNLDLTTGAVSSTVTLIECHGAAGVIDLLCVTTASDFSTLTSSVTQCNDSANGAGSTLECTVSVVNNITGDATASPATINQCVGSGAEGIEPTTLCNPVSSATGATVTQCNRSANGGGATERVKCDVTTSTTSAALPVTVTQCNDSANGGGSLVTCRASITNNILAGPTETTAPGSETTTPGATTPGDTTPSATTPGDTTPATSPGGGTPTGTGPDVTTTPDNTAPDNTGTTVALPTITLPFTGDTVPLTGSTIPSFTDITLPETGSSGAAGTGLLALVVTLVGAALVVAVRRRPANDD